MAIVKNRNKKGMTLVEMLVSIGIFSIAMSGLTALFINVWRSNKYSMELGQSVMVVSQGLGKMGNYIRGSRQSDNGSYPIVSASDNDLVIYSDYDKDNVTERLHIYKSGNNVLMGVRDPSGTMPKTYASGDAETVTLASSIINNSSHPIFQYFDENYPIDTTNNPIATPASVSRIKLVRVYLQINIDPNNAPDNVEMESFIDIRNLNDRI